MYCEVRYLWDWEVPIHYRCQYMTRWKLHFSPIHFHLHQSTLLVVNFQDQLPVQPFQSFTFHENLNMQWYRQHLSLFLKEYYLVYRIQMIGEKIIAFEIFNSLIYQLFKYFTLNRNKAHGMGWDGMGWDGMGWDGMGKILIYFFLPFSQSNISRRLIFIWIFWRERIKRDFY